MAISGEIGDVSAVVLRNATKNQPEAEWSRVLHTIYRNHFEM
jgi:hypothetical protein